MQPLERIDAPVRVAAAIWLGATRLTDNLLCTPPAFQPQAGVDKTFSNFVFPTFRCATLSSAAHGLCQPRRRCLPSPRLAQFE
jgi:hypothetical protein